MIISLKFTVKEKKMLAFLLNSTQLKQINHTYYLKKLPLERQLLLQSYKFEADYLASLAGDMLLEYGINKLYGITEIPLISLGEHGKPFLKIQIFILIFLTLENIHYVQLVTPLLVLTSKK